MRIKCLLAILLTLGILTMTPANATNHREVMPSDSRPVRTNVEPGLRPSVNVAARDKAEDPVPGQSKRLAATSAEGTGDRSPAANVLAPSARTPHEGRWRGFCSGWWLGENLSPADWAANPERGRRMMQRLIVCVFARFAPGQSGTALYVSDRESSFYPWARSPGGHLGLFQHAEPYWADRSRAYCWRGWWAPWVALPVSAYDPRCNATAAAKMVAAGGWGPWSTI
jgi:hypothetical protein